MAKSWLPKSKFNYTNIPTDQHTSRPIYQQTIIPSFHSIHHGIFKNGSYIGLIIPNPSHYTNRPTDQHTSIPTYQHTNIPSSCYNSFIMGFSEMYYNLKSIPLYQYTNRPTKQHTNRPTDPHSCCFHDCHCRQCHCCARKDIRAGISGYKAPSKPLPGRRHHYRREWHTVGRADMSSFSRRQTKYSLLPLI